MAIGRTRALAVACIAMSVGSIAAAQNLPTVTTEDVSAGVRSCLAATSAAGVDERKLLADGWRQGTMSANGKATDGRLSVFSRNGLLMMRDKKANRPICLFTARIASLDDFIKLRMAMTSAYGAPVKDDSRGEIIFFTTDKHIVDLASTGSKERPAVRIAVGFVTQESK